MGQSDGGRCPGVVPSSQATLGRVELTAEADCALSIVKQRCVQSLFALDRECETPSCLLSSCLDFPKTTDCDLEFQAKETLSSPMGLDGNEARIMSYLSVVAAAGLSGSGSQ